MLLDASIHAGPAAVVTTAEYLPNRVSASIFASKSEVWSAAILPVAYSTAIGAAISIANSKRLACKLAHND